MAIKRYIANKDNTITDSFKFNLSTRAYDSNMGSSDILEVFSIYGQASSASLEKTRILIEFPVDQIHKDRSQKLIPQSGSVRFHLVMSNAQHGQSTPEKFTVSAAPLLRPWDEGYGLDMETYIHEGASNWISASNDKSWHNQGGDYRDYHVNPYSKVPNEYTQYFKSGVENLNLDVTHIVEEWLLNEAGSMSSATASIKFTDDITRFSGSTLTLYSHEGQKGIFKFTKGHGGSDGIATEPTGSSGTMHFVPTGSSTSVLIQNLYNSITRAFSSNIVGQVETGNKLLELTQSSGGFFGNTVITSSVHQTSSIEIAAGNISDGDRFEIKFAGAGLASTFFSLTASDAAGTYNFAKGASNVAAATNLHNKINSISGITNYMSVTNPSNGKVVLRMIKPGPTDGSGSVALRLVNGGTIPANRVTINGTSNALNSGINQVKFNAPSIYDGLLSSSFAGGAGAPSYGFLIKMSGSHEDGKLKRSFYTKKFFARSSQYFFYRPHLEARWDNSIKDDRETLYLSSSAAPEEDNLNSIYLYNYQRNGLVDLPNTGSYLLVQLMTSSLGGTPETLKRSGGVMANSLTYITASRVEQGIYKAQFAYGGSATSLYDMWYKSDGTNASITALGLTGSEMKFQPRRNTFHHHSPSYMTKIINLKPSYNVNEQVTFRVFTRDKSWSPNLYTKATNKVPVTNIRNGYYKIKRISDNLTIIPYSTGSAVSFSSLSYDISGSYFDLDMSILEPNYLYEISFLYKFGEDHIEQREKFKFRVVS